MSVMNNDQESIATGKGNYNSDKKSVETIFYFHGYNGYLTHEKREVLTKYGKVIAPTFDYNSPKTLPAIIDSFKEIDLQSTVFAGTSFGGYVINVLQERYDIPCLLFNPALPYRILFEPQREPYFTNNLKSFSCFVLGKKDKLVRYQDNLDYISKYIKGPKEIIINEELGHSIPVKDFEMYTKGFFKKLEK